MTRKAQGFFNMSLGNFVRWKVLLETAVDLESLILIFGTYEIEVLLHMGGF